MCIPFHTHVSIRCPFDKYSKTGLFSSVQTDSYVDYHCLKHECFVYTVKWLFIDPLGEFIILRSSHMIRNIIYLSLVIGLLVFSHWFIKRKKNCIWLIDRVGCSKIWKQKLVLKYLSRKIPIGRWSASISIGIINGWRWARFFGYYSESAALYTWRCRTICSY